jgi:hypothetical protein
MPSKHAQIAFRLLHIKELSSASNSSLTCIALQALVNYALDGWLSINKKIK